MARPSTRGPVIKVKEKDSRGDAELGRGVDDRARSSSDLSSAADAVATASASSSVATVSPDAAAFSCKKCARGSSCWPVHVVTQSLAKMRDDSKRGRAASARRGGASSSSSSSSSRAIDPEAPWAAIDGLRADGHRPTFKTYTALITCVGELGTPRDAEVVLDRMRDAGESPDARAFNAVAHAWCAADDPRSAERVVERMLGEGVRPNDATYPEIVHAYAKAGATSRVEAVISRIESDAGELALGEKVYHAFVRGCCDGGRPEDAERVIERWRYEQFDMERVADKKGAICKPVAASYGMIIDHYARDGRMGDARRLLNQMQWDNVAPSIDVFNMLLRGYLAIGNVGAAQDVFRELEGGGTWDMESLGIEPDVVSYTSLLDHWAAVGDAELAEKVLSKMIAKGVTPDLRTFGALVKAHARAGDPESAEDVLRRMREFDAPAEKRRGGGGGGGGAGGKKKAPPANANAKTAAAARKKLKPNVVLYSTVVSAYASRGEMREAKRVIAQMPADGVKPNDRTYGHLVWGYGSLGDVAGITASARAMAEDGVSLRAGGPGRSALVRACRECGLPASHVDRMVDALTPTRKQNGNGGGGWRRKGDGGGGGGGEKRAGGGTRATKGKPGPAAPTASTLRVAGGSRGVGRVRVGGRPRAGSGARSVAARRAYGGGGVAGLAAVAARVFAFF